MDRGPSMYNGRNQVQPPLLKYDNQSRSETPYAWRREILKQKGQWNTPTGRRLVHFMPERWQQMAAKDNNSNTIHRNRQKPPLLSKKTPKKTHLDTLRRRERRQRSRVALLENSKALAQKIQANL